MSPETIPILFCTFTCVGPLLIGTGAFWAWRLFTNLNPSRDVVIFTDEDGRKHTVTDWSMLSREESKVHKLEEETE